MRICVYCASSSQTDPVYRAAAYKLGELLAEAHCTLVYGGGSAGSMGAVADGALSQGGEVIGVLPKFMADLEWGWPGKAQHPGDAAPGQRPDQGCPGWRQGPGTAAGRNGWFTMEYVEDMRERKYRMLTGSDAVVALPGGCGTLEELFEAITLKRLGLYFNPIVLLNTRGYYDALHAFLQRMIAERFMNPEHAEMWSVVDAPEDVLPAIRNAPRWDANARDYAVVR